MILLDTHIWVRWLISDKLNSELVDLATATSRDKISKQQAVGRQTGQGHKARQHTRRYFNPSLSGNSLF